MIKSVAVALIAFGIALTPVAQALGQTGPDYIGVFEAVNEKGARSELERKTPQAKTKLKAFGFAGGASEYVISGGTSPVRFNAGQRLEFVVRVQSQDIDPHSTVQFFALVPKQSTRHLPIMSVGALGIGSSRQLEHGIVEFNASKYGQNFFKIRPKLNLPPGEYALSTSDGKDAFLFGID